MVGTAQGGEISLVPIHRGGVAAATLRADLMNVVSHPATRDYHPSCEINSGRLLHGSAMDPHLEYTPWVTPKVVGNEGRSLFLEPQRFLARSCLEPLARTQGLERNQLTPATKLTTTLECLTALEFTGVPHTQYYKLHPCHFN